MKKSEIEQEEELMQQRLLLIQRKLYTVSDLKNQKLFYSDDANRYLPFDEEVIEFKLYILRLISAAMILVKVKKIKGLKEVNENDFIYSIVINSVLKQLQDFYTRFIETDKVKLNSFLSQNKSFSLFKMHVKSEVNRFEKEVETTLHLGEIYTLEYFDEPELDDETGKAYEAIKHYFDFYKKLYYSNIVKSGWEKNKIKIFDFSQSNFEEWQVPEDLAIDIENIFDEI